MSVARLHRRLATLMSGASLVAFAAGAAGFAPASLLLAGLGLGVALLWSPSPETGRRIARLTTPLGLLLAGRIVLVAFLQGGDVVEPVVDLLLLLMVSEALRPPETLNEVRLYALTLALLLAATAYRPGALFALAFAAYVVLASVTVPLGLLNRKGTRFGGPPPEPGRGFFVTAVGVSGVTLLSAGLVFLAFPRMARSWAGGGDVMATSIAGFSDQVSIGDHGARIYGNPQVVLRVEFPDGLPDRFLSIHWRGRSYDRFDGVRWTRTRGVRSSAPPTDWYRSNWPGPVLRQSIYAAPLDTRVLFAAYPLVGVEATGGIQPLFDNVGDYFYWGSTTPAYTAYSMAGRPGPEQLRSAQGGFFPDSSRYLQLPRVSDRIRSLADSLTAGLENRYDRVVAIEDYLRSEFLYTRELPATAGQATLEHFLFERRAGHCEYYSTAMVVMLRSLGIHSRNVNGLLGGRWNQFGGYLAVTQNEAHSWVEVWFPGIGWVDFDPTPGVSVEGEAQTRGFWFGRFWLDGLQHRWNKWVLDYSFGSQLDLMDRVSGWLGRDQGRRGTSGGGRLPVWAWLLAAIPALALALWRLPARGRSPGVLSRGYLGLARTARRVGVVGDEPLTPLALAGAIRRASPAAGPAADRAIRLYTRGRFGPAPLPPREVRAFHTAVKEARRALRS